MSNEMRIFESREFGKVRMLEENGKPLFCGTDVARALGYTNPRKAVRDHTKGGTKRSALTERGVQEMTFITEGDLYRLIVHSKLPGAERFETWVFDEVLPTIRQTGIYKGGEEKTADMQQALTGLTNLLTATATLANSLLRTAERMEAKMGQPKMAEPQAQAFVQMMNGVCKLELFPEGLRQTVDSMMEEMMESQAMNYSQIARFCTVQGYPISCQAVKRYFDKHFEA